MTLQMHAAIAASERLADTDTIAGSEPTIAADLIPRLFAMRRMIGATGFAVLSCPGGASRVAAQLVPVLVECATPRNAATDGDHRFFTRGATGRELAAHLEVSSLPLAWAGPGGKGLFTNGDCRSLLLRTRLDDARMAGVAFPVRLGSLGNGLVLFEGEELRLVAGTLFDLHRLTYRVMKDLLELEIRKSAPRQNLSDRELACLQWAGDGFKSEAIADKLGLSVHTVNAYLGSATAKLDAVNRIQAIAKAIRLGFIA